MSHYDLYAALHLDRAADAQTLATELDRRIVADGETGAPVNELRTARAVLGEPARRALYDRQLNSPDAPPITVAAVQELAALLLDAGNSAPSSGPAQAAAAEALPNSPRTASWAVPTLLTAVVVGVVASLVTWGITSDDEEPVAETYIETLPAITETVTETAEPTAKRMPALNENDEWMKRTGNYGFGTDARTKCNDRSQAQAVFVTEPDGNCESAVDLADYMHGEDPDTAADPRWTTFSHKQDRRIDVTCSTRSDGDDFPYWYCDAEGEAAYIIYL